MLPGRLLLSAVGHGSAKSRTPASPVPLGGHVRPARRGAARRTRAHEPIACVPVVVHHTSSSARRTPAPAGGWTPGRALTLPTSPRAPSLVGRAPELRLTGAPQLVRLPSGRLRPAPPLLFLVAKALRDHGTSPAPTSGRPSTGWPPPSSGPGRRAAVGRAGWSPRRPQSFAPLGVTTFSDGAPAHVAKPDRSSHSSSRSRCLPSRSARFIRRAVRLAVPPGGPGDDAGPDFPWCRGVVLASGR